MAKVSKQEQKEAIEHLRGMLKPGDTVYTILRHVSRSGMYRAVSLVVQTENGIKNIDHWASVLLWGYDSRHDGCKASGCGMDMGFHLVYSLGRALWPEGFKTWEGYWRNEPLGFDTDGGYALRQRWL